MGFHADGGLEKSIFLIFKSSQKKSGPNLAVLAPEKDSSGDLEEIPQKNHPNRCLGGDFLGIFCFFEKTDQRIKILTHFFRSLS